jgi:hypothetical protein
MKDCDGRPQFTPRGRLNKAKRDQAAIIRRVEGARRRSQAWIEEKHRGRRVTVRDLENLLYHRVKATTNFKRGGRMPDEYPVQLIVYLQEQIGEIPARATNTVCFVAKYCYELREGDEDFRRVLDEALKELRSQPREP